MNNTMIAQSYLPHQFVDPRKLNFRMNPYEMANQQAQMQQIFLRQQMQQRYVSRKFRNFWPCLINHNNFLKQLNKCNAIPYESKCINCNSTLQVFEFSHVRL